jgi:hypothetical protein
LRAGSCKRVNNLSKGHMEQLWTALHDNHFESFAAINAEVPLPAPSRLDPSSHPALGAVHARAGETAEVM